MKCYVNACVAGANIYILRQSALNDAEPLEFDSAYLKYAIGQHKDVLNVVLRSLRIRRDMHKG